MKTFKNKKGFTLIELLAVIVVLAIVTVLATSTILPYIADVRKQAFADEADEAIEAASRAMSLITIGSITEDDLKGNDGEYKKTDDSYCFSLSKLVDLGLWEKDKKELGANGYEGYVKVNTSNPSKAYTYVIKMHNSSLYVSGDGVNIKYDNDKKGEEQVIKDLDSSKKQETFNCGSSE